MIKHDCEDCGQPMTRAAGVYLCLDNEACISSDRGLCCWDDCGKEPLHAEVYCAEHLPIARAKFAAK